MSVKLLSAWKKLANKLKLETWTLFYAYKNSKTPWYAKAWLALVLAYAFSPIDLIPDFVPVLGYLDDLILLPLGIAIALRLLPKSVYAESKQLAQQRLEQKKPTNWAMAGIIIGIWVGAVILITYLVVRRLRQPAFMRSL